MERLQAPRRSRWHARMAVTRDALARELQELIAALDRRVPRVEHAGEVSIARDAAILRKKAVKRLKGLADQGPGE